MKAKLTLQAWYRTYGNEMQHREHWQIGGSPLCRHKDWFGGRG